MGQWWVLKILLYVSLCVRACDWVSEWVSEWGSIKLELIRRGEVLACSSSLGGGEGGIETTLCYAFEQALFATSLCIYIWPFGCQRVRIARRGEGREGKERAGLILIVQHYRSRDSSPFLFFLQVFGFVSSVLLAVDAIVFCARSDATQFWQQPVVVWEPPAILCINFEHATPEFGLLSQVTKWQQCNWKHLLTSSSFAFKRPFFFQLTLDTTHNLVPGFRWVLLTYFLYELSTPKIAGWYPNFALQNVSISLCSLQLLIIRSSPTSFVYNPSFTFWGRSWGSLGSPRLHPPSLKFVKTLLSICSYYSLQHSLQTPFHLRHIICPCLEIRCHCILFMNI